MNFISDLYLSYDETDQVLAIDSCITPVQGSFSTCLRCGRLPLIYHPENSIFHPTTNMGIRDLAKSILDYAWAVSTDSLSIKISLGNQTFAWHICEQKHYSLVTLRRRHFRVHCKWPLAARRAQCILVTKTNLGGDIFVACVAGA